VESKAKAIIDEYIANVNKMCHRLLEGINIQENLSLKTKWDFFEYRSKERKMEFEINGTSYKLHGRGCFVFSDDLFLNWDFGYRSRWCGIDPWMIGMTLKENKSKYVEYYDGMILKEVCEQAVTDGEMIKKHGLYHYAIPLAETFIPDFPIDYDTLIVQYFDSEWIIPRNKTVDRFLRKSNRIYNEVYNSENKHLLSFILDGKEVYSIPYDDICYPENAIKIMTDDILRNSKKKS